jgi:pimeloyl-ACP methyl ester carboxylesterase
MKKLGKIVGGVVAVVGLLLVAGVAATWAPDRPVSELRERWAPPPSQFVAIDGMQVHVRDEGPRDDPTPIVLLHGTSSSLHTWDGWARELSTQRRVLRLDLPGFGLTGPRPDGVYTLDSYAAFMRAVLDRFDIRRCVLVGNSFGGTVSIVTVLAMPERVEKLVLVDSGGYTLAGVSMPIGFRLANIPILNQLTAVTLPRAVIESSVRNVYGDPAKVTEELIDRYYEITLRAGNRHALVERFRQVPMGGIPERIPEVKVPTLILWGGRDRLAPPDRARWFERDIAGSRLVMFDDLGHVPQEEDPERTLAAAKPFLGID